MPGGFFGGIPVIPVATGEWIPPYFVLCDHSIPGGGYKYVFVFTPNFGENCLILSNIFQMG